MKSYITYGYNAQNSITKMCVYNAAGKLDDSLIGFSKLTISYASDGVTPTKQSFYRAGKLLAWQNFNAKTGEWGDYNF